MNKSEKGNNLQTRFMVAILLLTICVSVVTSIIVKTLIPAPPARTPTPGSTILPTVTLTLTGTSAPTPIATSWANALTPMPIDMPQIERNLLQNSGFEDGLSSWTYSDELNRDKFAGIRVFETAGVNGKAFCSRRYEVNKDSL